VVVETHVASQELWLTLGAGSREGASGPAGHDWRSTGGRGTSVVDWGGTSMPIGIVNVAPVALFI
jgi:hypothetical protein